MKKIAADPARGDRTRAALLAAGRRAFARRGFDGASVREITRLASANLGAVTYHFGSKRGLYEEVLRAGLAPAADRLERVAHGPGTPPERIGQVIEAFFEHLGANPDLPRLLMQEVAAGKQPPAAVMEILRRNIRNVSAILADGWEDGSLRRTDPVLSAVSVASQPIFMTVMNAALLRATGVDLRDPATRAAAVEHVKQLVLTGLTGRGGNG